MIQGSMSATCPDGVVSEKALWPKVGDAISLEIEHEEKASWRNWV
jgi:hypothetical protein